jgi:hypothetical protein
MLNRHPVSLLIVSTGLLVCPAAMASLIPPVFFDCVVAIGRRPLKVIRNEDGSIRSVQRGEFTPMASGFLYGDVVKRYPDKVEYQGYIITNWHVFEETHAAEKADIEKMRLEWFEQKGSQMPRIDWNAYVYFRFNPKDGKPARDFAVNLKRPDGTLAWRGDRDTDVAVIGFNPHVLDQAGIQYKVFKSDENIADRAKAIELGLSEGDGVYALGFPMGLTGGERNFVIARQGAIARIRDFLSGSRTNILIDLFVFPGNSGGPVISKPEMVHIKGTKGQNAAYLIGLVKAYLPYREIAISTHTRQPRMVFEENSGLAEVIPMDVVKSVIATHRKLFHPQ